MTLQAEDEIAAANMALGAAFAGQLAVTGTSGPGMDLKAETLGLAVIMELPMIIVDVQRGGPVHRHADQDRAERPAAGDVRPPRRVAAADRGGVLARRTASTTAIEAARIAVRYRTPVILLSDTFLSNSSEPWKLPDVDALPDDRAAVRDAPERQRTSCRTRATRSSPGRGPSRARRAWSTGSAGSSARTGPATSATTR